MASENFLEKILNPIEADKLQKFLSDPALVLVVKKVLLADVYYKGTLRQGIEPDPMRNAAFSLALAHPESTDEALGRDLRAQAEGARFVEAAFQRLEKFKVPVASTPPRRATGR